MYGSLDASILYESYGSSAFDIANLFVEMLPRVHFNTVNVGLSGSYCGHFETSSERDFCSM